MPQLAELLAGLTAEQVRSEARALERQARRLHMVADALEDEEPAPESDSVSTGAPSASREASAPANDEDALRALTAERPRPSNKRPAILEVVSSRPAPPWSPREIYEALVARQLVHPGTNPQTIRVAVHRMVDDGTLRKVADGAYTVPAQARAEPFPLDGGDT